MNWVFRRPFDFGTRARRWRTALLPKVLEFIASGGIVFGGSAVIANTYAPVASGGMIFGGTAPVAITLDHVASGGMIFGGSADVAFVHVEPTQGGMCFGGAADVAFTKAVVGSGGIVFGGRAYIGDVIGSKFWLNGPGFELGDLLRAQQVDFDKDHNPIGVYSIDAEVVDIRSGQKMVLQIASGKEYLTNALKGQVEFVRLGNRLNSARQGSVMVTSQPAGMMVMDGVDDFSKWGTLPTYKGVYGKLDWINDPDFGQLSGWGAFIPNLYAKGNIILGPYSSIQWANVGGTSKPADNATVGADWGSNLLGIPIRFAEAPTGSGLYICASYLGYYNGSAWKTYMDSSGNFYLGGTSGALQWNGVSLTISTVGNLSGAQGKVALTGGEIILYGSNDGGQSYFEAGYIAGEKSAGGSRYLNIKYDEYLRFLDGLGNPVLWLEQSNVVVQGNFIVRSGESNNFVIAPSGAVQTGSWAATAIEVIHGGTGAYNAAGARANLGIGEWGGASGATNPTQKRTLAIGGISVEVACYN